MTIIRTRPWMAAATLASSLVLLLNAAAFAEDTKPAPKPFKVEELASLLAPIALYHTGLALDRPQHLPKLDRSTDHDSVNR